MEKEYLVGGPTESMEWPLSSNGPKVGSDAIMVVNSSLLRKDEMLPTCSLCTDVALCSLHLFVCRDLSGSIEELTTNFASEPEIPR